MYVPVRLLSCPRQRRGWHFVGPSWGTGTGYRAGPRTEGHRMDWKLVAAMMLFLASQCLPALSRSLREGKKSWERWWTPVSGQDVDPAVSPGIGRAGLGQTGLLMPDLWCRARALQVQVWGLLEKISFWVWWTSKHIRDISDGAHWKHQGPAGGEWSAAAVPAKLHTESMTSGSERPHTESQLHSLLARLWASHRPLRASVSLSVQWAGSGCPPQARCEGSGRLSRSRWH